MRLAFLVFLCLVLSAAHAQAPAPDSPTPAASKWNFGLKLGTGASYANYYSTSYANQPHPWTAYTGGLSGGYGFPAAGGFLNLQADVLLERRKARPWQMPSVANTVLFVPLYIRTDRAAARVHLLLGGGPTFWLTGRAVPDNQAAFYATHSVEATMLAGLEVRLLPLSRYETTVALTYRHSFTPALTHFRRSPGGTPYQDSNVHSWFGATLNVYLHPVGRP